MSKSDSPTAIVAKQVALTAAIIVGLVAVVVGLFVWGFSKRPAKAKVERVTSEAVVNCQNALRAGLNYPATAKFPFSGQTTRVDAGQFYVWYDFTAKNAFGVEGSMRGMCVFPPGSSKNPEVSLTQQ